MTTLTVDVSKVDGGPAAMDVEWFRSECTQTDVHTCVSLSRRAYGAPTTRWRWSLDAVTARATVTYTQSRVTCTIVDETEVCGDPELSTGTATVRIDWTATGEPVRSTWTDNEGRRHVVQTSEAVAGGVAFGEAFDPADSFVTQIHRDRTVTADR